MIDHPGVPFTTWGTHRIAQSLYSLLYTPALAFLGCGSWEGEGEVNPGSDSQSDGWQTQSGAVVAAKASLNYSPTWPLFRTQPPFSPSCPLPTIVSPKQMDKRPGERAKKCCTSENEIVDNISPSSLWRRKSCKTKQCVW